MGGDGAAVSGAAPTPIAWFVDTRRPATGRTTRAARRPSRARAQAPPGRRDAARRVVRGSSRPALSARSVTWREWHPRDADEPVGPSVVEEAQAAALVQSDAPSGKGAARRLDGSSRDRSDERAGPICAGDRAAHGRSALLFRRSGRARGNRGRRRPGGSTRSASRTNATSESFASRKSASSRPRRSSARCARRSTRTFSSTR